MGVKKAGGGIVEINSPTKSWWVSSPRVSSQESLRGVTRLSPAISLPTSTVASELPSTLCVENAIYEGVFVLQEMLAILELLNKETHLLARWALKFKLHSLLRAGLIEEGVSDALSVLESFENT